MGAKEVRELNLREKDLPAHFLREFDRPRTKRELYQCISNRSIPIDLFSSRDLEGVPICRFCGTPVTNKRAKYCYKSFNRLCSQILFHQFCTTQYPIGVKGTCENCGAQGQMDVHHIMPVKNLREMIEAGVVTSLRQVHHYLLSRENLALLCERCHNDTKNKWYYKYGICGNFKQYDNPWLYSLDEFLCELANYDRYDPLTVDNIYKTYSSVKPNTLLQFIHYQLRNLRTFLYLAHKRTLKRGTPPPLMVGEAPGYKGAKQSGIPFTSLHDLFFPPHRIFEYPKQYRVAFSHKVQGFVDTVKKTGKYDAFLKELRQKYHERTASTFWNFFKVARLPAPLVWNAFPFHPHQKGASATSNRKPTTAEVAGTGRFLQELVDLFNVEQVVAIGRVAEKILQNTFPDMEITYVRHPSHGGITKFREGMADFYNIKLPKFTRNTKLDSFLKD